MTRRLDIAAVVRSYPRDRRRAKAAGASWWLFIRIWIQSWRIGHKATDPSEAKLAAYTWVERHPHLRKKP
jgi:hypothetical protein